MIALPRVCRKKNGVYGKIICLIFFIFFNGVLYSQQPDVHKNIHASHLSDQVVLRSPDLIVSIDRKTGLPKNYHYKTSDIPGVDSASSVKVIVCRLKPRNYKTVATWPKAVKATVNAVNFYFEISFEGQPAASFYLNYVLKDRALFITMQKVTEQRGFELIEASLPNLATVREETGQAWLAHASGGGSVVNLKEATTGSLPENNFFGKIGYVLPIAIIGTEKMQCIMEVTAFMNGMEAAITGTPGHRHARIGTVQVYRVHGGRAYDMNDGGPPVNGNEQTPNLLVGQMPQCRLDFAGDEDGNGIVDWLDAAKIVRMRMPEIPTHYFDDKFIYLIAGKYKPEKEPRTTFAQTEKLSHDIAMLTDFAPQLPLISGWAYDGQDTGFPSEDSVNSTLGGYDALLHAIKEGRTYNANVSINTNYDDAYKSSPIFDTAFIARRPDGKIWRSLDWAGEYSYITGMAKYMKGWGRQRMDYTVKHFGIQHAILVDALTWHAIRNDWDPRHPASGYKNLIEGRYQVFDEFAKRGIQVMSEQLRYAFIGKQAVSADGTGGGKCPFGGEPVPLMAAIYRKSAIWGAGSFSPDQVKKNLFWNCRPMPWYNNKSDRTAIIDYYFLTVVPYNKIHNLDIQSYRRIGYRSIIGLDKASSVEVDWMNNEYSVILDGVAIAANDATFCQIDMNRIAVYSRRDRDLQIQLPRSWSSDSITARALFVDHREEVPVKIIGGMIGIAAKAAKPVIIYRNALAAGER